MNAATTEKRIGSGRVIENPRDPFQAGKGTSRQTSITAAIASRTTSELVEIEIRTVLDAE